MLMSVVVNWKGVLLYKGGIGGIRGKGLGDRGKLEFMWNSLTVVAGEKGVKLNRYRRHLKLIGQLDW